MKSRIQLIFGKLKKSIHVFQLRVGGDSYDQPSTVGQSDTKGAHCYRGHFLWVRFVQFLLVGLDDSTLKGECHVMFSIVTCGMSEFGINFLPGLVDSAAILSNAVGWDAAR